MKKWDVVAPYDRKLIATFPLADSDEALDLVGKVHQLFNDRARRLAPLKRRQILNQAADIVETRREELARTACREGGKPLVDSRVELERAVQGIREAAAAIDRLTGHEVAMGLTASSLQRRAFTFCEPIGPVLAISAFNHPFNLIVHQAVTAVAAGCPVIVKPSLATPMSCQNLVGILHEAGLPPEWCQMLLCTDDVTETIAGDPRIAFVNFIGAAAVGWNLRRKIAPGTRCALEHGGAAPVILDASARLAEALPMIAKGGFYHAGQVCVSVQRVFVHESQWEQACRQLTDLARSMVVGDPLDPATEIGPLIRPRDAQRVHSWVQEAVAGGATLLAGGTPLSETLYPATVLAEPPPHANVSREEIFGPVICLYRFDDLSEAIKMANNVPYAFQAAIYTQNLEVAMQCVEQLAATTVLVNDHTAFRIDSMPFGGQKLSGLGVGGIYPTMKELTYEKMMVMRSPVIGL